MELDKNSKIYVAGHRGMVGSALLRTLKGKGYTNLVFQTKDQLNLLDTQAVYSFLMKERPEYLFISAAKVGGIYANDNFRAQFIFENLQIQANLIHGAHLASVPRLMFLGSSCIYPKECMQPIKEEYLLTGPLEQTNEPYAIAKIAGIKMAEAYNAQYGHKYISVMPTNLYGPNDNYDLMSSHVLPAIIRKVHEAKFSNAKGIQIWGTGMPRREFLHVDDLADACVFLMESGYSGPLINIGTGKDISIYELALMVMDVVGFKGEINFDSSKPDGTMQKLLDVSRLNDLGWRASIDLRDGIADAYRQAPFNNQQRI